MKRRYKKQEPSVATWPSWAEIGTCDEKVDATCSHCHSSVGTRECGRKPTHVIFLNTPFDKVYVVGSCSEHKETDGGFKYFTLSKFERAIAKARAAGVKEGVDLAIAVTEDIYPEFLKSDGDDEGDDWGAEDEDEDEQ